MNKLITTLLLALSTTLFAQDQVAKDVLDNLGNATKEYKNMTVDFDFIFENESQNIKEKQNGKLEVEGNQFRLTMSEQTVINDGKFQWIYLPEINEVQIMEHDPEDEMMTPNKLFNIYEEDYKYIYIGAKSEKGKRLHIIDLYPKESGAFIKINLVVDAAKNEIYSIVMQDKNGGTYSYLVNSFSSNNKLKPFKFNAENYPGLEVIDLR